MKKNSKRFSVTLMEEEYENLYVLADACGRPTAAYARQILRWYLRGHGSFLEPSQFFRWAMEQAGEERLLPLTPQQP